MALKATFLVRNFVNADGAGTVDMAVEDIQKDADLQGLAFAEGVGDLLDVGDDTVGRGNKELSSAARRSKSRKKANTQMVR